MNKFFLLVFSFWCYLLGYSQVPAKRIDSIVTTIEAKKTLTVNVVADTFLVANSDLVNIESVKFYSAKGNLNKIIFSAYFHRKDSTRNNITAEYEVFYFNNDILIKVISRDFDQSPPKDLHFYLGEKEKKKFDSKETMNFSKYDGVNYFIEFGYVLLIEFKQLNQK